MTIGPKKETLFRQLEKRSAQKITSCESKSIFPTCDVCGRSCMNGISHEKRPTTETLLHRKRLAKETFIRASMHTCVKVQTSCRSVYLTCAARSKAVQQPHASMSIQKCLVDLYNTAKYIYVNVLQIYICSKGAACNIVSRHHCIHVHMKVSDRSIHQH